MFEYDGLTVPRQEEGAHDVRQDLAFSTGSLLGRIAGIEDGAVLLDFGGGTVSPDATGRGHGEAGLCGQLVAPSLGGTPGLDEGMVSNPVEREFSLTIPELFRQRCSRTPDRVAFRAKEYGIYQEVTWRAYRERVRHVCLGLLEIGVEPGDRVAIMGDPCPEWCYADLATQSLGAITYGIYSTSSPSQVRYLLENGGATVAVAENQEYVDKILPLADGLPALRKVIVADTRALFFYKDQRLMTFGELEELGRKRSEREPGLFEELVGRGNPDDVAFLVYTSGTSGPPKPAMISHRNCLTALVGAFGEIFPGLGSGEHRTVSYLSMAHILERVLTGYL
ncbi:MAG: AMP-binding protein, partial [Anaerolineae bacterium]